MFISIDELKNFNAIAEIFFMMGTTVKNLPLGNTIVNLSLVTHEEIYV
jgi:hypothetical protein